MSPRAKSFKAGSIIYFEGDKADAIFLLKEGKVNLIYDDLTANEKIVDQISTGEFFGVKSGLIHYPREETAKVVINSVVFEFSSIEFESLILKNTGIILKMLKVFSNQLRKVGKQIQSLIGNKVLNNPSDEFFLIGDYYFKNKKYKQAITVYQRYQHYYPTGKYADLAIKRLKMADSALSSYGEGGGPSPVLDGIIETQKAGASDPVNSNNTIFEQPEINEPDLGDTEENQNPKEEKLYYKGVSFMSQGKYLDAFNIFKRILEMENEEHKIAANAEIGKCYYYLNKYEDCVRHLSNFLSKQASYQDKAEIFYYIGLSYNKLGNNEKAGKIFNNILSTSNESDSIYRKAQKALKELG